MAIALDGLRVFLLMVFNFHSFIVQCKQPHVTNGHHTGWYRWRQSLQDVALRLGRRKEKKEKQGELKIPGKQNVRLTLVPTPLCTQLSVLSEQLICSAFPCPPPPTL